MRKPPAALINAISAAGGFLVAKRMNYLAVIPLQIWVAGPRLTG